MNKNSIIYFGGAIPVDIEEEVSRADLIPHIASQKFSWSVIRALHCNFEKIFNISSCDIRNFPAATKLAFNSRSFSRYGIKGFFVGFINLLLLKHASRMLIVFFLAPFIVYRNRSKYVLVHGSHTPFMLAAIFLKLIFRVRIAIILTDQHGRDVTSDGWMGRFLRTVDTWFMRFLLQWFDAYICLSPAFISKFNLCNFFVVPGILNEEFNASVKANETKRNTNDFFDIIFAGGVATENGVDKLLGAFERIDNPNARLFIYGAGQLVGDVKEAARRDSRIYYGGVLHGDALARGLLAANLLINPRPVCDEYAHTSFPSKLIEYMATGVPTLTTRLVSIPNEVMDCFYFIDGDSEENISQALVDVMNTPLFERLGKGSLAAERVSSLYSEASFGRRVYELLSSRSS